MSRIKQGWALTKKSWALLRSNRELFRFPIYGALAAIVIVLVTVGPGLYLIDDGQRVIGGVLTAIGLYLSSFIVVYFGVALAATADAIFHGRQATTADGFAVARERIGAIAGWAALAALVGTADLAAAAERQHRRGDHRHARRRRLVADHLPRRPRDHLRGHRPVGDAEAVNASLQGALGGPDHRQRRDRRHRRPARRAARDRPDRPGRLLLGLRRQRRPRPRGRADRGRRDAASWSRC